MRQGMMRYSLGILLVLTATVALAQQPVTRIAVLNNSVQNLQLTVTAALPTDFTVDSTPDTTDTVRPQRPLYYTIGGVRLKFAFDATTLTALEQAANPTYSWVMNAAGASCTSFSDTNCTARAAADALTGNHEIWWEPSNWTIGLNAEAELTISFNNSAVNPDKVIRFRVANRELQPLAAPNTMEGSDVAMLERMLWQLGLGPNESQRGSRSTRKATNLDTYDTGCSVSACSTTPNQATSMEWMIWRFKYASEINGTYTGNDNLTISNHVMNQASLNILKDHWEDFYEAFRGETTTTVNGSHAQYQAWLTAGATEWDDGSIYLATRHQAIMQKANSTTVSRSDFLDGWVLQESSRSHWGVNNTDHRINIGTSDSRGSVGFHQVQSRFIWGALSGNACTYFSSRNLYAPSLGASAIVWWGVKPGCGTAFQQAMDRIFDGDYDNSGVVKLRRSDHDTNALAAGANYLTDDYERLSKGIAGYNQGVASLDTISWPELLKTIHPTTGSANTRLGIHYAIDVKTKASINLRNYLWLDQNASSDFCFWYGEADWFSGTTWAAARAEALTQAVGQAGGRRVLCP